MPTITVVNLPEGTNIDGGVLEGLSSGDDLTILSGTSTRFYAQNPFNGAYFEVVYPAFWRRELDIEDAAVVAGCIEQAGVDPTGFDAYQAGEGRARHDALQAQLHPAGIYGVPTYVFDGHILFGREHLPYIRWHLSGREGAAPDIAYELA